MPSKAKSAEPVPGAGKADPTVLFGAFDRHNFGDLLFPHVAAALLPDRDLIFAALATRDLRSQGGHRVRALAEFAAERGGRPINLIHVGGELLTCEAWQAAVMLLPPEEAQSVAARLDDRPAERLAWARQRLGINDLAPYCAARSRLPGVAALSYNAVGGVDFVARPAALRDEVLEKLKDADIVSVRDHQTQAALAAEGIPARMVPDPGVMVAELFGAAIREHAQAGEVAEMLRTFPQGYVAVQFSADFGDDASLAEIAAQLDVVAAATGLGVVFFRAGAAPWHDDLDCYRRVARYLRQARSRIFNSLNLWDICALIASSRAYCGSSLHGRIVAAAFAMPRLSLLHPAHEHRASKQAAYAATWEPDLPAAVGIQGLASGLAQALGADRARLQGIAAELAARYRAGFDAVAAVLE